MHPTDVTDPTDAALAALAARIRFVLVEPVHPGNIGAAARAIKAMGFGRLAVVAPQARGWREHAEAIAMATHGAEVLAHAPLEPDLTSALRGVHLAFATTGYAREFGPRLVDLRGAAAEVRAALADPAREVAFVFGTERSGLTNADVERCQACCAIPADPRFGSLNLAQAVQVVAYECRLALLESIGADPIGKPAVAKPLVGNAFEAEPPASVDATERMLDHLERALVELGYLDPAEPRRLLARLRRLFTRAQPTASEIDILRGVAAAIIRRKSERKGERKGESAGSGRAS